MDESLASGTVLLALRIAPTFTLAPPFAQLRVPARVRIVLVLALAASMAAVAPSAPPTRSLVVAACTELLLGALVAFGFQAAFAGLAFAGRTLDIQAGYGLALVIDPGTSNQAPLFGTMLTLLGGLLFFAMDGHIELVRLFVLLNHWVPPGSSVAFDAPARVVAMLGACIATGTAVVAAPMVALFMVDVVIAWLSRTLPQMNALMLGLQVKTAVTLLVTAASVGIAGPVILRLLRQAFEFAPSVVAP
jgi:flagellar biosynthesis protein FliR